MTINDTWAYNAHDRHFKSSTDLIRGLVEVASRGGNFLLNVGPQPDGMIQPEFQERLRAIGDWITVNGDSIYETTYGPIQGQSAYRMTAKGSDLYVHIFDWPSNFAHHSRPLRKGAFGAPPREQPAAPLCTNSKRSFRHASIPATRCKRERPCAQDALAQCRRSKSCCSISSRVHPSAPQWR